MKAKIIYTLSMADSPWIEIVGIFKRKEDAEKAFDEARKKDYGYDDEDEDSDWVLTKIEDIELPDNVKDSCCVVTLVDWIECVESEIIGAFVNVADAEQKLSEVYDKIKSDYNTIDEVAITKQSFHLADESLMRDSYGDIMVAQVDKMIKQKRTYRIIQIDYEVDETKTPYDEDELDGIVGGLIVSRAEAHNHTIDSGIQITDIQDLGESS